MTPDDMDRALRLEGSGLLTEGIGPQAEWSPVPPDVYQRRHDTFWRIVTGLLTDADEDYDDLPDYLTEVGTEQLESNN